MTMECECGNNIQEARWFLGYKTCLDCGEQHAIKVRSNWCIAPLHKSNYILVTDSNDLKGINNKGGLFK